MGYYAGFFKPRWIPDPKERLVQWQWFSFDPLDSITARDLAWICRFKLFGRRHQAPADFDMGPHFVRGELSQLLWTGQCNVPDPQYAWNVRFPDDTRPRR